jgi:hypothetical protein
MNKNLCKPCAEKLRQAGKQLTVQAIARDYKITCAECGRRRFGALYDVRRGRRTR